jgi:hypothetical protein
MKKIYLVLLVLVLASPALGEVTIGTGTVSSGNVYTTGSIYVSSTPAGASAVLDGGSAQLVTSGTFINVPPGQHSVMIAKPGYQSSTTTVNVSVGTTVNVLITLEPVTMAGGISVSSTPRGSGLYVDNLYQGITDMIVGNLQPGPHKVTVAEPGYQASTQNVTVLSGQVVPVSFTLVPESNPPTGDIRVTSTPSGAVVYLNGDYKGFTPPNDHLDINDLAPGTYTVSLTRLGYLDYSTSVTLPAGGFIPVNATLVPSPTPPTVATAEIVSTPSGAEVYINNAFVGITPLVSQNVTPGTYTVELRLQGYTPFSTSGTVLAGQDIRVIAALTPVATPTPTAPVSPLLSLLALGIVALAAHLILLRR